jgi:hypothetical protein
MRGRAHQSNESYFLSPLRGFVGQPLKIVIGLEVRLPTLADVEAYKSLAAIENDSQLISLALKERKIFAAF